MDKSDADCPYPGCFFCLIRDINPSKRRPSIAKFFKELPSQDDEGQVIPISGLWNSAMAQPSNAEFVDLGVFECMAALIWKGLTNRRWLSHDQNIYIPYYAAHVIGSYTMIVEDFAERAVAAGVIPALLELLRGRLSWVEQRVAVRALGHLATYDSTFPYIASYGEILELAMQLSVDAPEIVYTHFYQFVDKRLAYHCDLLTRGVGGLEMENRNAESWASQLQCWSLQLINCFAFKEEFLPTICQREFLVKLSGMWGGLANENSPAGVGLLRTLCHQKVGRQAVSDCQQVIEALCNVARSSDDWQHMAVDCLVWLIQNLETRYKVLDRALAALLDLAELPSSDHKKLGDLLIHMLVYDSEFMSPSSLSPKTKSLLEDLEALHRRMRWEKNLPKEDLQIRLAAALVSKLEGNAQFSAGDIAAAASKYTEALNLCPIKAKKERITLYSNRAQCQLLLQNPEAAISDTTRALCIHNPVNRHGKSLWRRSQAYECLGLAKESLLDAIMFVNECIQAGDSELKHNSKVPRYVDQLIKKQMQASWLFNEAALKHGGVHCEQEDEYNSEESDNDEHSEWETASESDILNDCESEDSSQVDDQRQWPIKGGERNSDQGVALRDIVGNYYQNSY